MSIISVLIKPFVNKAKKDLSDLVQNFIESRKHADEDGNGEADFKQAQEAGGDIVEGIKLIASGGTRIAALAMCYYLKFGPKQKQEVLAALPNKIEILEDLA